MNKTSIKYGDELVCIKEMHKKVNHNKILQHSVGDRYKITYAFISQEDEKIKVIKYNSLVYYILSWKELKQHFVLRGDRIRNIAKSFIND